MNTQIEITRGNYYVSEQAPSLIRAAGPESEENHPGFWRDLLLYKGGVFHDGKNHGPSAFGLWSLDQEKNGPLREVSEAEAKFIFDDLAVSIGFTGTFEETFEL